MNVQEALLHERIDPHLSDRALTALAKAAASQALEHDLPLTREPTVHGYEVLTGGCWNRVIGVSAGGLDLVYKISPHPHDPKILREYEVLQVFADGTDLQVPVPLYCDDGALLPGTTLVMTRIPGVVLHQCRGLLNFGQRRQITDAVAQDLSALHKKTSSGFGGVELPQEERQTRWSGFWLPRFDQVLEETAASGSIPAHLIKGAQEVRPHLRAILDRVTVSTMTHYDIWSGNVMVDLEVTPPRVSGYIDVPGFYADYARELSFAMLFGIANQRFYGTYLEHHTLDDGFELRANIYNLKMNIKHIQMYPSHMVYQRGATENLEFIRKAL